MRELGGTRDIWNMFGRYGINNVNSNGLNLLQLCSELNFAICNTFFRKKKKHKVTWTHPRSKHGHMIDFIITRRNDLRDVWVLCGANCYNDHKMVSGKFMFQIQKKIHMEGVKVPKRINASKLHQPDMCKQLYDTFDNLNFDGTWGNLKDKMYAIIGVVVLGLSQRNHRDWFDENDTQINQLSPPISFEPTP